MILEISLEVTFRVQPSCKATLNRSGLAVGVRTEELSFHVRFFLPSFQQAEWMTPTYIYEPREDRLTSHGSWISQVFLSPVYTSQDSRRARQIENDVSHIKYHLNYRDEVHTLLRWTLTTQLSMRLLRTEATLLSLKKSLVFPDLEHWGRRANPGVPELRLLFHGHTSTLLCQPVALELVGANCLHLEADELPTIQNGAVKGAKRHLVDLCGTASSPFTILYLVLPGYQGIFGSQPVSS